MQAYKYISFDSKEQDKDLVSTLRFSPDADYLLVGNLSLTKFIF